jgi:hypothetical protein
MPAKAQVNLRISEPGKTRLAALTQLYGSQTTAVEIAIDRLYQQEIKTMNGSDLFDLFAAPETSPDDMVGMALETVTLQIGELRANEPDDIDMTDEEIAHDILKFAQSQPRT